MAQHDYSVANASGASVRSDLNNVLSAIVTWNSGTAPATTFARMRWVDTSTGTVKRRNAANSAWLVESTDDETRVLARASNTILDVSDIGKTIVATGTYTQTFDAAATLGDGWSVHYRNNGTGYITLDPNASETIDGATVLRLAPGESCAIYCNGTSFTTYGLGAIKAGFMFDFGGTAVPTGYLGCDGSAVSRTTYAALFAAIGTTWGVGDGSTTFNLPDFRRRAAVGSGGSGTATLGNAVGNTGGAETHLLTGTESGTAAHNHSASGSFTYSQAGGGATTFVQAGTDGQGTDAQVKGVSVTVNNSASSSAASAHNNMQPSAVVLKIIKT